VLAVGFGAWNLALRRDSDENDVIARLLTNPEAAHPLTDSSLPAPASGVLYSVPNDDEAFLVALSLPQLPPDQRYQVWFIDQSGVPISGGLFLPDANGTAEVLLEAPSELETYSSIGITTEPYDGSEAPTTPIVLGGSIH
jgi:anti-sigma-K factor RskA